MENTNPWLEITKQKEQPVFNETLIQNQIARLKYQKFLKTYEENTKEFQNPTVESDYQQEDIDFVTRMFDDWENITAARFDDKYFEYFTVDEIEQISEKIREGIGAIDLIDFLYEEGIWY